MWCFIPALKDLINLEALPESYSTKRVRAITFVKIATTNVN